MAEAVRFHFDPLCPWCYQTSRWARRLAELGEITLDWGVFSLEIVNADAGADVRDSARAAPALRAAVVVRDRYGADAVGRFYAALGERIHERGEDVTDRHTLIHALVDAGLDESLLDAAVADAATWDQVEAEHGDLVERTRSFGVPTIVLDGGTGPAIFGPVVSNVPDDGDAVQLWRCVAWLARYENFSELKRDRTTEPDLESVRRRRATSGG